MGRVLRRTSTKHRSMALVVRSFRHRCRGNSKNVSSAGRSRSSRFTNVEYLALPAKPKSLERSAGGGLAGGLIDALGVPLDGVVVGSPHRLAQIAHLVHPAALVPRSRIHGRDRRGQARTAVGDHQLQPPAPQSPAIQIIQQSFPGGLAFALGPHKGQQLTATVGAHSVGHQQQHFLRPKRSPHFQPHPVQQQIAPVIAQRRVMELRHLFIQHPRQPRDRLRAHRFFGQKRHHPAHPARRDPSQKRLPNHLAHLRSAPLQRPHPARQKRAQPRPRHPETNPSQRGDILAFVKPIPVVDAPRFSGRSFMPLQPQILGHLLLGVGFQQLLQRFPRPSLKIAPEALLQVPHKRFKPLCVILDSHSGVGSFTGDFVARHNKTYTLSLFTHSNLRHLCKGFARRRIEKVTRGRDVP